MRQKNAAAHKLFLTLLTITLLSAGFVQDSLLYLFPQSPVRSSVLTVKAANGQWIKESNGKWWYKHSDSSYTKNDWEYIDGKWYHFDSSGWMQTGWISKKGKWYYLDSSGAMQTGWLQWNGNWCYLDSSGAMQTGWLQWNGSWYYLDSSGAMKTGWNKINNKWYYLNGSGVMLTGWRHIEYPGVYENEPYWNYFNSSGEFITDSDVMGSTAGYNTFGNHKNNKGITLTYSISLSKHSRSDVISGANLWNNTSNFKGKLTLTSSNANIKVKEASLSNISNIAVTHMYSGFANLIDVDPEKENWNKATIVLNTRTNVPISSIAHEFGHAMGLSHHITKRDSIMTQLRFKRSVSAPTYYDANILSNIY